MKITILGSTGSVGSQTLEVIDNLKSNNYEKIEIIGITGHNNIIKLEEQIRKYKPKFCSVNEKFYKDLKIRTSDTNTQIVHDNEFVASNHVDIVISAITGISGLMPTFAAIKNSKRVAIANKEPIVVAGQLLIKEAKKYKTSIIPMDSEHSTIFQLLKGNKKNVKKIILTASGGPFFGKKRHELEKVKMAEVLAHPTWKMGTKITIDSATLMNKGFEIIEANVLFGIKEIDVVIHKESLIHSMIELKDGNILAELSPTDMKFPIKYAITYPKRVTNHFESLDFRKINSLTFYEPDEETFECLKLAKYVLKAGNSFPVVLNAANDIAIEKFLNKEINFLDIPKIIERKLEAHKVIKNPNLNEIIKINEETKNLFNI